MDFASELQRQRVLIRWRKRDEKESETTVVDKRQRNILLARVIAYIQGDGCLIVRPLKHEGFRYDICFYPDNIHVAELFSDTYLQLYGRLPKIKPEINHYRIRVVHKKAGKELTELAKFYGLDWELPYSVLDSSESKKEWLKAFFDSEAYVGKRTIVVNSVNKKGLQQVQQLLNELEIQSRLYEYHRKQKNWNTNYILSIMRIGDRQNFLKRVGFNHPAKQEKLINSLAGVA